MNGERLALHYGHSIMFAGKSPPFHNAKTPSLSLHKENNDQEKTLLN